MSDHQQILEESMRQYPEEDDLPLDELCLPTYCSQVGRNTEWNALLDAYRRAAGVPGGSTYYAGSSYDDNLSVLNEESQKSIESTTTTEQDQQSLGEGGYQVTVVQGKAGTGKSFLVQRLRKCIMESFQINFGTTAQDERRGGGNLLSATESYRDDTTISTKSGGFLNKDAQQERAPNSTANDDYINFSELPTGLFAQGAFTHGGATSSPFSAFTECFNDILEQLICDNLVDPGSLKLSLVDAVGSEETLSRLVTIVPKLTYVLEECDCEDMLEDRFSFNSDTVDNQDNNNTRESSLLSTDSTRGILFLLRSFVKALCKIVSTYYGGPIVIFLEDAECMDATSAKLLKTLASNESSSSGHDSSFQNSNLLIILAVRPEVFQQDHRLCDTMQSLKSKTKTTTPPQQQQRYMEIELHDLSLQDVHLLVSQALRRKPAQDDDDDGSDENYIQPLSGLIYQRTLGNSFFVVELLRTLAEKKLLTFCVHTLRWTFDIEQVQAETSISNNVVALVSQKLQTLTKEARYVLVMASCLHSTIELEVLSKIVLHYSPPSKKDHNNMMYYNKDSPRHNNNKRTTDTSWVSNHWLALDEAIDSCPKSISVEMDVLLTLDSLVACGLMERVMPATNSLKPGRRSGVFKFSHDRIRQAAQALIPQDFNGQMLHVRVGELLRKMVHDQQGQAQTWMLFACLDHLNRGPDSIIEEHLLELVHLNRQAGEKAMELSAFLPASNYFCAGINLLKANGLVGQEWVLLLQLQTKLSICHYRTGNLEESETAAKLVLASSISLQEKLPLYYNLIQVYKARGNLEEAVNIGMDLLNQVGEKFSKNPSKLRIAMEKSKVDKLLKQYTDQQLTRLPRCNNELKGAAVNVYAILFGPMHHLGCPAAVDLLRLRSLYLTLKYGSMDSSALASAYYASHLISEGDIEGGYRFGKLAMELLQKAETEELTSRTILVANFLSLHWKQPLSQTLDPLMNGYNVGMINGDIEMAFTNAGLYQTHYYYCGLPLKTGERDLCRFIKQMEDYGQHKELSQYKPLWQTMLNLMGKSKVDPTTMTGDAMDQTQFEQGKPGVVVMKSYRMQLAYYFGKLELAQSLMDELRPHSNSFVAPFFQVARRFFFALTRMGMARKVPKKKQSALLKKTAKEDVEWLETRVRNGAINCLHKLLILKAEMATFESSEDEIWRAFNKAIVTAGRSGFSQDEALANELAASHFLSAGNFQRASDCLTRAHDLYGAWGAAGKVKQLEDRYVLIKGSRPMPSNSSSRSHHNLGYHERFSNRFSEAHRSIGASDAASIVTRESKVAEKRPSNSDTSWTATSTAIVSTHA